MSFAAPTVSTTTVIFEELGVMSRDMLGVTPERFLEDMGPRQSAANVADAVIGIAKKPPAEPGSIFTISADGMAAAS